MKITKERILFALGAGGFAREVAVGGATERPMLLMACLVMMGVPAFLPEVRRFRDEFQGGLGSSPPTSPSAQDSSESSERSTDKPSSSARTGVTVALL